MRGKLLAAKLEPEMIMSTVPSVRPWLMSFSLPSCEAGYTSIWYRPLVRFSISWAAHTELVWKGSEVSYTCAHFSVVCASALPDTDRMAEASSVLTALPCFIVVSSLLRLSGRRRGCYEYRCLWWSGVTYKLHLGTARAVGGQFKGLGRALERQLRAHQWPHVDPAGAQERNGPIEFDAGTKGAHVVQFTRHDAVGGKRHARGGQGAYLHDAPAAPHGGQAGVQRRRAAGRLDGHIGHIGQIGRRRPVGSQRVVGADLPCYRQRPVGDVGNHNLRGAGQFRGQRRHAADGAAASDQHRLA